MNKKVKSDMDNEIIKIFKNNKSQHAIIVVMFKGRSMPEYCAPMPRNPEPKLNIPLNNDFSEIYFSALRKNPSIKDGAILIQVDRNSPILRGFSYRIYLPSLNVLRLKNMGSGYNSSLDFSGVERIECVYFINKSGVKKFINGKEITLY